MTVRNLQFVNGILSYKGFIIEHRSGIDDEFYGSYIWNEYSASQFGCCESIIEESLEQILDSIDVKIGETQ